MRGRIEAQIGKKFDYYQPLVYRVAPYLTPIPPGGGPGPVLTERDIIIKVSPYNHVTLLSLDWYRLLLSLILRLFIFLFMKH